MMDENINSLEQKFIEEIQEAKNLHEKTLVALEDNKNLDPKYNVFKKDRDKFLSIFKDSSFLKEKSEKIEVNFFSKIFRASEYRESIAEFEEYLLSYKESQRDMILSEFEEELDKILKNTALSEEERKLYLNSKQLEDMNIDDYLTLMKRLSGNFLSHVTRYGIREQYFSYHQAGKMEFFDSFKELLKEGKISSFMSSIMNNIKYKELIVSNPNIKDIVLNEYDDLHLDDEKKVQLKDKLFEELNNDENHPLDRFAPHFAVNDVASNLYGAEKGYDFFFYYPAEVIAYNYQVDSMIGSNPFANNDVLEKYQVGDSDDRNDVIVLNNNNEGISINVGIVCIPGDVDVDPKNGSQYEIINSEVILDENNNPIKATNTIKSKEYWENFFKENISLKPSKIMYYEGNNRIPRVNNTLSETESNTNKYSDLFKNAQYYDRSSDEFNKDYLIRKKIVRTELDDFLDNIIEDIIFENNNL